MSIDTLLVLTGPLKRDQRAPHTAKLYREAAVKPEHIIITGNYTGMADYTETCCIRPKVPDAAVLKESMVQNGIPSERILLETEALDTVANFVLSYPILKEVQAKHVGLVTDAYHMRRSLALAQRILPREFEITARPTSNNGLAIGSINIAGLQERIIEKMILHDLRHIKDGDIAGFGAYLQERHPFHAPRYGNQPPLGAYRMLVEAKRRLPI